MSMRTTEIELARIGIDPTALRSVAPTSAVAAPTATTTAAGTVKKGAAVADETTANATDLATAQALANALKVKMNALLVSLRAAGHI